MSLVLALTAFKATTGLVLVFFVAFPLLLHGLLGFAGAQASTERKENQEYLQAREDNAPQP